MTEPLSPPERAALISMLASGRLIPNVGGWASKRRVHRRETINRLVKLGLAVIERKRPRSPDAKVWLTEAGMTRARHERAIAIGAAADATVAAFDGALT
jgi:hypothetical protein